MSNVIAVIILLIVLGAAVTHIVKEKKRGAKCIECPAGGSCAMKNSKKPEKNTEHSEHGCGCHRVNQL